MGVLAEIDFADLHGAAASRQPRAAPPRSQLRNQVPDRGHDNGAQPALIPVDRNDAAVIVTHHANGILSAKLPESFDEALVVTQNADGTYTYSCIHGLPAATRHVQSAKAAQTAAPTARKVEVK